MGAKCSGCTARNSPRKKPCQVGFDSRRSQSAVGGMVVPSGWQAGKTAKLGGYMTVYELYTDLADGYAELAITYRSQAKTFRDMAALRESQAEDASKAACKHMDERDGLSVEAAQKEVQV